MNYFVLLQSLAWQPYHLVYKDLNICETFKVAVILKRELKKKILPNTHDQCIACRF